MPDDETPLYQRIAESLRQDIAAGTFDETGKLPGEKALAGQWKTSTATSANALKLLEREGTIEIRRGVGAFVRRRKPIIRDANGRLSREQWGAGKAIWQFDLGDHYPVPETVVFRDGDEKAPEVPDFVRAVIPADRYVIRDRRYTVEGWPIQVATSFFDAAIAEGTEIANRDSGPGGVYARLAELGHEPVAFLEQVRSRLPLDEEAKRLRITPDKPISEIVRQAKTADGRVVEINVMLLLGDAYLLQYAFTS
jgi:GntR family transcriptional regulator